MTDIFRELYTCLELDRKKSAWSKKQTMQTRTRELEREVEELRLAITEEDSEHISEELGDALWDVLSLIVIAQEQKMTTIDSILRKSIEKLQRRKPWLFSNEEVNVEEELRRWKEIKQWELEQGLRKP